MEASLGGDSKIDVRNFGARGDGITDDAPAFRRALAAASSTRSPVQVPDGRYALREDVDREFACVHLPAGTSLYGSGTLLFGPGVRDSVKLLNIAHPSVTVRGISMDLSNAPGGTSFAISIQSGARDVLLADLSARGNVKHGGIQLTGGEGITIQGCQILDMAQNGVTLYGNGVGEGPSRVLIDNCHISSHVQPVDCEPVNGALCRNVTIRSSHLVALSDNYALTLSGSRSSLIQDCTLRGSLYLALAADAWVERCLIDASSSIDLDAVVAFGNSSRCTLTDNIIDAAVNRVGIHIARRTFGVPRNFNISSNRVRAVGNAGVMVTDARDIRVFENQIVGRGPAAVDVSVPSQVAGQSITVRDNRASGFSEPLKVHVRRG